MATDAVLAEAVNPDGKLVVVYSSTWDHVVWRHPLMDDYLDVTMAIIRAPDHREPDPRPGRERYFGRGGHYSWIRVITEFAGVEDRVVTAFPQTTPPSRLEQS